MPTSRGGAAAAVRNERLFVIGGEGARTDSGVFAAVEAYDPTFDLWEHRPAMITPRHGMGAATWGDAIYVPGGATQQVFGASAATKALVFPDADGAE